VCLLVYGFVYALCVLCVLCALGCFAWFGVLCVLESGLSSLELE